MQTDSAYKYLIKALKFADGDMQEIARLNLEIASFFYDQGDYGSAEEKIFQTLNLRRIIPLNNLTLHLAYANLGIIYCDLKNYETSLKYHLKSLDAIEWENPPNSTFVELAYNNIGYNYQQNGKIAESIKYFKLGLKGKDVANDPVLLSRLWDNLGYSYLLVANFKNSKEYLHRALKMRREISYIPGLIFSNLHLSEYYGTLNDFERSKSLYNTAYKLSKVYNLPNEELHCLRYSLKNGFNKISISRALIISDSLQLAERRARNKFARIAFETDEITQEKDQAIQDKWLVVSVASLALLLTLTTAIIIRQRARQKELVFAQEQQLANNSIYQLMHDQQARINEGRQNEKKRIARELHDGVMNRLASTRLNLFILNKKKDEETVTKCLPFINEIQGIEKEIRQVAHDLDNDLFSGNVTFNNILEEYFASRNNVGQALIHHDITTNINWNAIDSTLKINIYRIIQEAVNNVEKHSDAANVYITIERDANQIRLLVHDDGTGFDISRKRNGIGLKNITTRAKLSGGSVDIKSGINQGTLLTVTLPITDVI